MLPLITVTFLQGVRSRIFFGIFVFSLFVVVLSAVFANFFMQDLGKVAFDFNISAISVAGLLISASLSVNLIAQDLDKRTIYFVLSRPISRTRYIWGKYFGLLAVFFFAYFLLTIVSCFTLLYLKHQFSLYFSSFSWLAYLQAIYFDFLKIMVFNSIILLFAVITTSSFVNLLFSLATYLVGQSISDVINFISIGAGKETVTPMVHDLLFFLRYIIPNFELFDVKVISAHGMFVSAADFCYFTMYGVVYSTIVLCLTATIFKRKELL
jgi:ABC-type transport system involved in multi-copper enzyme maturation permease subunit